MVNLLIFLVVFSLAELSYRVYRDGFGMAVDKLMDLLRDVPYSNLGTGNWVIYDEQLGYRLNPQKPRINSLSIRHGVVLIPKPEGVHRILVLGDSIPWDNPGFVNYIEEMFPQKGTVELINAAVPGDTTYQEVLFFKRYLLQTQPDLVLWTYCLNDNHKFLHRFDEHARMLWTDEALASLKTTTYFDVVVSRSYILSAIKLKVLERRKQRQVCQFPWECVPDFSIAWKDEPWVRYEAYLDEMKRLTREIQSQLAIVIFPYEPQFEQFDLAHNADYILKPQKQINALCQKYDVPCLDLFPAYRKAKGNPDKLFRDGIHLTKEGHQLTAKLIYSFLQEKDLLSGVHFEQQVGAGLP